MVVVARSRTRSLVTAGLVLGAVYLVVFLIVGATRFGRTGGGSVALGATLDLTVTAGAVVWWFAVRPGALPWWVVLAVLSWGVVVARVWVPHAPVQALAVAGAALEVVSVGWLLLRIRRVVRAARVAREEGPIGSIEAGLIAARVPARVAAVLATELAVVGLALTGWFRRPPAGALSMRSTGWMTIASVIGLLVVVESGATHVALAQWSPPAAWLASASSAYMLLWLIGDAQAIRLYPVAVTGGVLRLRLGVRWRATVPLSAIAAIEEIRAVPAGAVNLALMEPTVLVTLRAPIEVRGLLGKRRRGDRIALTIDDPRALMAAIAAASPA